MNKLSDDQVAILIAGIRGEKVDNEAFKIAASRLRRGSALHPVGMAIDRPIPETRKEWRADTQWPIELIERHQRACDAAHAAYWGIMGENN